MRRIKKIRRDLGESQRAFAARFGIDVAYICNAERNGIMYAGHLQRVAKGLGYKADPSTLLEDIPEQKEVATNA